MMSHTDQDAHDTDGDAAATHDVTPDMSDENSAIAALNGELAAMTDRWMRSEAEIDNVRKRAKKDVDEARQFALQKFAGDVVEAAENLKRGLGSLPQATAGEPQSMSGLRAGLADIERGFITSLKKNGIKALDPTGGAFVPDLHQAIGDREVADQPPGTVLQALGPVWTLNGRLLKPAMVIVAKAPDVTGTTPDI